jgi:nucleotide-binding universal stress UspA family protein
MNPDMPNSNLAPDSSRGQQPPEGRQSVSIRKILAPIDFSKSSDKALQYASSLAVQFQATLILVHVVEFSFVGSEFGAVELSQIEADMRENGRKQLETLEQKLVDPRLETKLIIASGRPSVEIIETAMDEAADLIVIASHGHPSLAHVILGSTVERVVRHASCPVLVVRGADGSLAPTNR